MATFFVSFDGLQAHRAAPVLATTNRDIHTMENNSKTAPLPQVKPVMGEGETWRNTTGAVLFASDHGLEWHLRDREFKTELLERGLIFRIRQRYYTTDESGLFAAVVEQIRRRSQQHATREAAYRAAREQSTA